MNQWTNSTHVVNAVGEYTGISTSTPAPKPDGYVMDERLSAANCLAMMHQPDIFHICRDRIGDMWDGEEEFKRVCNHYKHYYKPSVDVRKEAALCGATFIDVCDSFNINEHMFHRDTHDAAAEGVGTQLESWKLSLCFIHPPGPAGCLPADLKHSYDLAEHTLTGNILHLLIHCPSVHDIVLASFEKNKSEFLRKMLQFAQYCAGQGRNTSKMRDAAACEKKIVFASVISAVFSTFSILCFTLYFLNIEIIVILLHMHYNCTCPFYMQDLSRSHSTTWN